MTVAFPWRGEIWRVDLDHEPATHRSKQPIDRLKRRVRAIGPDAEHRRPTTATRRQFSASVSWVHSSALTRSRSIRTRSARTLAASIRVFNNSPLIRESLAAQQIALTDQGVTSERGRLQHSTAGGARINWDAPACDLVIGEDNEAVETAPALGGSAD